MKNLFLIILLLLSYSCFPQPEKDSLFARDAAGIYNTLKVMNHLDRAVMDYYRMPIDDKKASELNFQKYLENNIIATNPVSDVNILHYLGVYIQKDVPQDWPSFVKKVNNTNAKMLITIADLYGYPSKERLEKFTSVNAEISALNFAIRHSDYQYALGKMLRKENRKGNVSDSELEIFKTIGGKTYVTYKDVENLEKIKQKQLKKESKSQ